MGFDVLIDRPAGGAVLAGPVFVAQEVAVHQIIPGGEGFLDDLGHLQGFVQGLALGVIVRHIVPAQEGHGPAEIPAVNGVGAFFLVGLVGPGHKRALRFVRENFPQIGRVFLFAVGGEAFLVQQGHQFCEFAPVALGQKPIHIFNGGVPICDAPPLVQHLGHHFFRNGVGLHTAKNGIVPAVQFRQHCVEAVYPEDGVRRAGGLFLLHRPVCVFGSFSAVRRVLLAASGQKDQRQGCCQQQAYQLFYVCLESHRFIPLFLVVQHCRKFLPPCPEGPCPPPDPGRRFAAVPASPGPAAE